MFALRTLILFIAALNIAAVLVFLANSGSKSYAKKQELYTQHLQQHKFNDPVVAFNIFRKLDRARKVPPEYFNMLKPPRTLYHETFLGLKRDEDYCLKVRGYFVDHPETYFNEKNFMTDFSPESLTRSKVIAEIGHDRMPNISYYLPKKDREKPKFSLKPNINLFFSNAQLHHYQEIGKNFLCLPQVYNHIPGIGTLARKELMAQAVIDYAATYKGKPACFNVRKFFPETMLLDEPEPCRNFFKFIDSEEYQNEKKEKGIVFIRKIAGEGHKGEGIQVVNSDEELNLRSIYQNGTRCGEIHQGHIIQRYIYNPLLLDGRKFDIRVYLLIASANPVIAFYHDGFLRVSAYDYEVVDSDDDDDKSDRRRMLKEGKESFNTWDLEDLNDYLRENKLTKSKKWIDEYLRPALQEAMVHIVRMTQESFYKHSGVYELLGVDFMLDENLNLWYLETNASPVLSSTNKEKAKALRKMMVDMFEIVHTYLKSRVKRLIDYINWLSLDQVVDNKYLDGVIIPNIEERYREFDELNKNKLEAQFTINKDNKWVKIIDENLEPKNRYGGFIASECL